MKKQAVWRSLIIAVMVLLATTASVRAELKTSNGITGNTYTSGSYANAYTSATQSQYSMTVTARVWGG